MKSRGALRGMFAGALALALATVPAVSATADTGSSWWYDYYKVGQVQSEGWTGNGVKVAVLDEQINPDLPVFQGTSLRVSDQSFCGSSATSAQVTEESRHGSNTTALLIGNGQGPSAVHGISPGADVTFYGFGTSGTCTTKTVDGVGLSGFGRAFRAAVDEGNTVITTSVGWEYLVPGDVTLLASALAKGIIVVATTANDPSQTTDFPAASNGVVAVNGMTSAGAVQRSENDPNVPNIVPWATVLAAGEGLAGLGDLQAGSWTASETSGASLATPLVAGMLAVAKQKYPKATANQLIQSLIHNTTPEDHPLARDETSGYGYGPASLTHLLAVDPSQYPDKNPLLDKASGEPTAKQIADAGTASTAAPSATAGATGEQHSGSGVPVPLVVGIVVGIVVIAGIIVVVVVLGGRRRKKTTGGIA
ncbi:S8 family serine peptidase [Leifsonia aquatica]|uniref:S8 family serine peptidase n=1 Tax=Leifsonia aquatica TaxID=144185 RepID=UPI00384B4327